MLSFFRSLNADQKIDLLKWVIGTAALTAISLIGTWVFQYYSLRAEKEKTSRELRIKERDMQLQYLDKFTSTAIDQDITKRIRLAHYISSTIDRQEFSQLAKQWSDYYKALVNACQDRLKQAMRAGKKEIQDELTIEPACAVGGLETLLSSTRPFFGAVRCFDDEKSEKLMSEIAVKNYRIRAESCADPTASWTAYSYRITNMGPNTFPVQWKDAALSSWVGPHSQALSTRVSMSSAIKAETEIVFGGNETFKVLAIVPRNSP